MYYKRQILEVKKAGLSAPLLLSSGFPMRYRVFVPEGVTAVFGVKCTIDATDKMDAVEWADDETIEPGTAESAMGEYTSPMSAICLDVEMIDGGSIFLKTLEPQG